MLVFYGLLVRVEIPASFAGMKLRMLTTFFVYPDFPVNFNLLWIKLKTKILTLSVAEWALIVSYNRNLDRHQKCLLFLGRLDLPFEAIVVTTIIKFISSAVAKICTLRIARLREL